MSFDRKSHCQKIAALGGKKTVEKYGREHMSKIGKRGFSAFVAKYNRVPVQALPPDQRGNMRFTQWALVNRETGEVRRG